MNEHSNYFTKDIFQSEAKISKPLITALKKCTKGKDLEPENTKSWC